jgi:multidrug efflux system membrane fusion protein
MIRSTSPLMLLTSTVLAGCNAPKGPTSSSVERRVPVTLAIAHEEPLDSLYRTSGTVRGRTTAVLTSKMVGYVRSVDVRAGDRVKVGQVLAVLEANDSSASVRRAHAGLDESMDARTEAENAVAAAEAGFRIAKSTHERVAWLYTSRAVSQQELDEAQARCKPPRRRRRWPVPVCACQFRASHRPRRRSARRRPR